MADPSSACVLHRRCERVGVMVVLLAAFCVFVAVWSLSLPPMAAFRLGAVLPAASRGPGAGEWTRRVRGLLIRRRRDIAARRTTVIEFCDGIAVELAAGLPPATALLKAAESLPGMPALAQVTEAARDGGDVAGALERAAEVPGCDGLRLLAGCWRIGVERGGALVAVIEGLADALRDEQAHRDEVALQLAGPRATARLLAALPLLGLAMSMALGVGPLSFLLGTLPGWGCRVLGVGLDLLGLWWIRRLSTAAEEFR
jgi:tight adherence protein B